MNCLDYIEREKRKAELALRRAERKPNAPKEELAGLREKMRVLGELETIVKEHFGRAHSPEENA